MKECARLQIQQIGDMTHNAFFVVHLTVHDIQGLHRDLKTDKIFEHFTLNMSFLFFHTQFIVIAMQCTHTYYLTLSLYHPN